MSKKRKRLRKNEQVVRELQDNMKHNNVCILGIPEGEGEEEQGVENLFEKVMMEKYPNVMRGKSHMNPGNTKSPRHEEPKEAHYKTHNN